jgi:proteic killer suppression protein
LRYYRAIIKTFKNKLTEKAAKGEHHRKLPSDIRVRAKMRLDRINAANQLDDLRVPPSHNLEKLSGDRVGQYSIRINGQFRICFEWENGDVYNVEIIDYH